MQKNRSYTILKWVGVAILLGGIVWFWQRMEDAGSTAYSSNTTSVAKTQATEKPAIDLYRIEEVGVQDGLPSVIKEYEGFRVDFNPKRHTPNAVSWILMGNETEGQSSRSNKFWTDSEMDGCADTRDYSRSGYDRGHMCPAGEQKWSEEAMHHSFVMSNICPQDHDLNTGAWKTLEDKERIWARRDSLIVIVAGPIYNSKRPKTIGKNKVAVPDAFFKVLLAPYADPVRAIGFVYPNMKSTGNMEQYATTVDEVELLTGMDFFASLPDDIEEKVESASSFIEWNNNRKKR